MKIRQAIAEDNGLIHDLAVPAWEVAYADILTKEQFAYMIEKMYSDEALKQQMKDGHTFFIVSLDDGKPIGFVSINPKSESLYILEKLYVLPEAHGSGAGRFLVEHVEKHICELHPGKKITLELNVNRNNKAVNFYQHIGYHADRKVDEYIGNGFYKNDYIMQKILG
ncbi:MAG: GNAT family N-acetyltransferase [Bacteroidales bacterium]|jgi:GNAT superfamily N-acetyltransferase|nr:GNAT family N-acetyltransferase [Bacteroidales bacterium]